MGYTREDDIPQTPFILVRNVSEHHALRSGGSLGLVM